MAIVSSNPERRERRSAPAIVLMVSAFGLFVPLVAIPFIFNAVDNASPPPQSLALAGEPVSFDQPTADAPVDVLSPVVGMRAPDPGYASIDWQALRDKQAGGDVPPPAPPSATPVVQAPPAAQATTAGPGDAAESTAQEGRGARGRRGGRRGDAGADSSERGTAGRVARPPAPRPGIAVTDPLVIETCSPCHERNDEGFMTRLSYMRKSPEGWEISLKRMLRLYGVELEPGQAKQMIRYLANDHGLARAEAASSMYEAERRVHWSEEDQAEDLRETCAKCHTLGRVFSERRDAKEWNLLKATHLAMFPLADFQAFRGSRNRGGRGGGNFDWSTLTEVEAEERMEQMQRQPQKDRADEVLGRLAKELPLFSDDWKTWAVNRREVPVAGRYTVIGHEITRGDVRGEVVIRRDGQDTYSTTWDLRYGDGRKVHREGKGILYAGYSWRGRSTTSAPREPETLREVLLLSEDWTRFEGRVFTGGYNELGLDVTLHRHSGAPQIFALDHASLMIPSEGNVVDVIGTGFPEGLVAADFHVGDGVTVTALERVSGDHVRMTVDVARKTDRGTRLISMRNVRGPRDIVLYDTIDYIKIFPEEGFARVGGKMRPKQNERFEAYAMNRGPDDKPYTKDDYKVKLVDAKWHVEEFPIRPNDDDAKFVGTIDPATGFFTPGLDGPNPQRHFKANNIGDVYVVATVTLTVQELPKKKKKKKTPDEPDPNLAEGAGDDDNNQDSDSDSGEAGADDESATEQGSQSHDEDGGESESGHPVAIQDEAADETVDVEEELPPIRMVTREFRARGHLLVTVPIWVQWDRYEWDTGR